MRPSIWKAPRLSLPAAIRSAAWEIPNITKEEANARQLWLRIQEVVGINSLGDLTEEQFEQYKSAIKDDVRTKRAKHAVYENQRAIKAVAALKANDIAQFGQLMNASHVSLRDDYEVTGIELDTWWKKPGRWTRYRFPYDRRRLRRLHCQYR